MRSPVQHFLPKAGAGTIRLLVNRVVVAEKRVDQFPTSVGSITEGFDIGQDRDSPVSLDQVASQKFTGSLGETRLELK